MRHRDLGQTGLVVSEIGFGAWGIGGRTVAQTSYGDTDDGVSIAALKRAHEVGVTFYDTSAAYGDGHSEELIGRALADVRDRIVLATKAGYDAWDRPPDFSASQIVASAERSLRRLRTDWVDVLLLHNASPEVVAAADVQEAVAGLVRSGKVRSWGLSARSPADALAALRSCDVPIIQANFNMMDIRAVDCGLFEEIDRRCTGFIARTPLCFGFLSGTITRETRFPDGDHRMAWPAAQLVNWIDGARDLLAVVSAEPGPAAVQAALRFCLSFPQVSTTIPGILNSREADENATASDRGPLDAAAVAAVLEINARRRFFVARATSM